MATGRSRSSSKTDRSGSELSSFWDGTGDSLPAFFGAPSTGYYFEGERMLFERFFGKLAGKKILKTDLWDEAKNTRILIWAAKQGAEAFGLDISRQIIEEARSEFLRERIELKAALSDLRSIAFKDGSFDFLYSMGTVEHFPEIPKALSECRRVLKKGGIAIIGVPNKFDPFLRPLVVSYLQRLGHYAYGEELSFSMKTLEKMVERAGFELVGRSGLLFMPGWLRMAELFLYVRRPEWKYVFAPLVGFFALLVRLFPRLNRHGYLIACAVRKP